MDVINLANWVYFDSLLGLLTLLMLNNDLLTGRSLTCMLVHDKIALRRVSILSLMMLVLCVLVTWVRVGANAMMDQ